eukprot:TRINITY_DN57513_c0_g1_i1.p1 TRINITY_DN57513_c0_g1~~TRINITY_DN57513_c0_g1_i1.p1  ORF type:complete len:291 (-),score=55.34 TRINITY_DN57513_c0_g1_i1:174-1046(-)
MQEPLDGRRVIISGKVKEISNAELAAMLEGYGRVERITAGFMTDIAFALFEQKSAAQAACTAAKGGLRLLNFRLSVRKANEHVYRQSCKIYNVGPTFPLSPAEGSFRTQQDLEQNAETNDAMRPSSNGVNNELADMPESTTEHSGMPDSLVINFNIAGGDEEKIPDKLWSCNWAELQTKKLADVSAAKRRRSRKKGKKKGEDTGNADSERCWRSSSKPKVPTTTAVGRLPCNEERVRSAHVELAATHRQSQGTQCYDLSTPQLKPACPSSRVVEDLEDLDAKSDSSCFWD